ncbi:MAG: hypothetical protein ACT4QB_10540 [Gammaproteobacteria bacterium]
MAKKTESRRDSFDALKNRFMSLLCRLQVLSDVLGNCNLVPKELQPAAYCFDETIKEVAQLYDDLDRAGAWDHEHTPNAKEVQS